MNGRRYASEEDENCKVNGFGGGDGYRCFLWLGMGVSLAEWIVEKY